MVKVQKIPYSAFYYYFCAQINLYGQVTANQIAYC